MNRRQFVGTLGAAAGAGLILPQVARLDSQTPPFPYTRAHDIFRALPLMAAGLAATLDASLRLREPGQLYEAPVDWFEGRQRAALGFHWYEAPFFLTDRELAEGPTNAMQYREAVKALRNQAQHLGVTRFYPMQAAFPDDPLEWGKVEARYGRAIARAQVERQHLRHRWSLSFLGA